jgi:hypothetical protein
MARCGSQYSSSGSCQSAESKMAISVQILQAKSLLPGREKDRMRGKLQRDRPSLKQRPSIDRPWEMLRQTAPQHDAGVQPDAIPCRLAAMQKAR